MLKRILDYIYGAFIALLIITTVVIGIIFRINTPNCGISDMKSIADIQPGTIILNYAWNKSEERRFTSAGLNEGNDKYGVDEAQVIAVVSPTGSLDQTESSIGQEFVVKEILKGNEIADIGETAYIYQNFGFYPIEGKIEYMNIINLMYTGNDYLLFVNPSPLNEYLEENVYLLQSEDFGYIKIGPQETQTLDSNFRNYDFTELQDYEFFSITDTVTEALNNARAELLDKYYYKEWQ